MNLNTILIVCISIMIIDGKSNELTSSSMRKRQYHFRKTGAYCSPKECLSKYGSCGKTEEHCGKGCLGGPCWKDFGYSSSEDVGFKGKGGQCSYGECLSKYGYCGRSDEHCGEGCQSGPCY